MLRRPGSRQLLGRDRPSEVSWYGRPVQRARGVLLILVLVVAAAACSNGDPIEDEAGPCPLKPGADCQNLDLRNADFVDAELTGSNFTGSDLSGADMRGTDLSGANLTDTILARTDLTEANLTNANLTNAFLFFTNLTDADLSGTNQTGAERCNVVETDGSITLGGLTGADGVFRGCGETTVTTVAPVGVAPTIDYFRVAKPGKCLNDASGTGVDVEWKAPNSTNLTFLVDGVRIQTAATPRGIVRLPFECNNKNHIISLTAFGAVQPPATSAFTLSLPPVAPFNGEE